MVGNSLMECACSTSITVNVHVAVMRREQFLDVEEVTFPRLPR